MSGPSTGSLEIRHTPGTVPGGARPGWGLPYQQLPGAQIPQGRLTSESMLNQEIQTGRQAIQDKYALQWKNANRSRRFIGVAKTNRLLQEIDARAKQEMLQFNQRAQQQLIQLQNIDRLAQQGAITNPEEIKMRMYNPDLARSMYPTPEKGRTPATVMNELNRYKEIIQSNLDRYKTVKIPWWRKGKLKEKTLYLDYDLPAKKEGEVGAWRDATEEDIQDQDFWKQELEEVKKREMEIVRIPGIKHRIVQPGTTGGTFSDKVVEPYKKPVRQRPRPIRHQPGTVPEPKTEQEYNALPPGTRYKHPSGDIRIKR